MNTVLTQTRRVTIDPTLAARRRESAQSQNAMAMLIADIAQRGADVPQALTDQYLTAYRERVSLDDQIRAEYVTPLEGEEMTATWKINSYAGIIDVTLNPKGGLGSSGQSLANRYLEELDICRTGHEREKAHYQELYALRKSGVTLDEELNWQMRQADARYQEDLERMERWLASMVRAGYGTEADYTALTGKPFPADSEAIANE